MVACWLQFCFFGSKRSVCCSLTSHLVQRARRELRQSLHFKNLNFKKRQKTEKIISEKNMELTCGEQSETHLAVYMEVKGQNDFTLFHFSVLLCV